jgi:hypothetical protein
MIVSDIQHIHNHHNEHSVTVLYYYAECHYAKCHILFFVMLKAIMPNVSHFSHCYSQCYYAECHISFNVMLNVIMVSVTFYLLLY